VDASGVVLCGGNGCHPFSLVGLCVFSRLGSKKINNNNNNKKRLKKVGKHCAHTCHCGGHGNSVFPTFELKKKKKNLTKF